MAYALAGIAGWTLLAFAGAPRWAVAVATAAAVIVTVIIRPRLFPRPHQRCDRLVTVALAAATVQLLPLPDAARRALSPSAEVVDETLRVGPRLAAIARPLSLDPTSTAWAIATAIGVTLVFWCARDTFERGGMRTVSRAIALLGLLLAVTVFVQQRVSPHRIYGFWSPVARTSNPTPFGPFLNRNDLACWLLMAIPLTIGYGATRIAARRHGRGIKDAIDATLDTWTVIVAGSVVLMTAALVATLSRSGLVGLSVGLSATALIGRRRLGTKGLGGVAVAMVALAWIALQYANVAALAYRLSDTLPADMGGRLVIWRESWPIARDFIGTGVGIGAFERAMLVYQQSSRVLFFNHAHNEYLQVLAEGGLLVAVPVACALLVGIAAACHRLAHDETPIFWLRAGALGAVAAVAAQSVWDTGLRMPANAALFAIVAATALHADRRHAPAAER